MNTINPYIGFNGKCREAMIFYQQCFGGDLELREVAGSPMEQSWQGDKDQIFHSALTISGNPFIMGSDMRDQNGYIKGNNITLAIGCSSEDNIRNLFEDLSKNGKVLKPLKEASWGGLFGSIEDQFGITWFLNYENDNS